MSENTHVIHEMFEAWQKMNANVSRSFFELAAEPYKTESYEQLYRCWANGLTEVIEKAMHMPQCSKTAWENFKPLANMYKAGTQITETMLRNMKMPTHSDIAELSQRLKDLDDRIERLEKLEKKTAQA